MTGFQLIVVGVVLLAGYVGVLVYIDRMARAPAGVPAADRGNGSRGLIWAQYVLLIGGHFFLVIGTVKSILGLSPSFGIGGAF